MTILSVRDLKDQAKRLRGALEGAGTPVSHSKALELVAEQNGYRDWNTAKAMAPETAPSNKSSAPFHVGDAVSGHYLGQHFTGRIKAVAGIGEHYRVTTSFDAPVDVVTFESFSNYRRQVTTLVDRHGVSPKKISDGTPHMVFAP